MAPNRTAEGPGPMAAPGWDKETPPPFCDVRHGAVAGAFGPSENVPGPWSGGVYKHLRGRGVNWEVGLPESYGEVGEPVAELHSVLRPFNLWRLFPPNPPTFSLGANLKYFFTSHRSRLDLLSYITRFLYSPAFLFNFNVIFLYPVTFFFFFFNRRILLE